MKLTEESVMKKYEKIIKPDPTLQNNLMAWGFCCGSGWLGIIDEALSKIEKLDLPKDFEIFQVKEKFGSLRICTSGNVCEDTFEELQKIINEAEEKSSKTCECCGNEGKTENIRGWFCTLCNDCKTETAKEEI